MTKKRNILSDHKKEGRKLVPPFTHLLGPFTEISWVKVIVPEILWIALIQNYFGHRRGAELVTKIARAARASWPDGEKSPFAAASSFANLSGPAAHQFRETLNEHETLNLVREPLAKLVYWYPDCPHRCLFPNEIRGPDASDLRKIREIVGALFNRSDRDPMMVQATAIWLAFDAGILKVEQSLALAQFPKIEEYPTTELSRKIGSGIRATLNALLGHQHDSGRDHWPAYFWNRGLQIDPCEFSDAE